MPLKVLLTDKEIEKLLGVEFRNTYSGYVADYLAVRDAQLRKVVEWLSISSDDAGVQLNKVDWQSLLDEVKDATE